MFFHIFLFSVLNTVKNTQSSFTGCSLLPHTKYFTVTSEILEVSSHGFWQESQLFLSGLFPFLYIPLIHQSIFKEFSTDTTEAFNASICKH